MTAPGDSLAFRSAVEAAYLAADHLRAQLPKDNLPPPDGLEAGFHRYAPDSRELQTWLVWRRLVLLERAYIDWRTALEAEAKAPVNEAATPETREAGHVLG